MKALIYAVLSVIVAGMAMYSAYLQRQIDKGIEKFDKEEEDNDKAD